MKEMLDKTFFILTFTPGADNGFLGSMLWVSVNTILRLGMLYATVRVVATAIEHGGF